jgi:hypothetical protein
MTTQTTPSVLARFRLEFGAERGDGFYHRGLTLYQARGENRSFRCSVGSLDVSKLDDAPQARPAPAPAPKALAAPKKPVPSKTAAVGTREWAACLIANFGQDRGVRFIQRELSYLEALDIATEERNSAAAALAAKPAAGGDADGFAGKIRFAKTETRQLAAPRPGERQNSLAAKLRFQSPAFRLSKPKPAAAAS